MSQSFNEALQTFLEKANPVSWSHLNFFAEREGKGTAKKIMELIDAEVSTGKTILPPVHNVFRALELTPIDKTKVVILGQDPYPTIGDAHGLAFSYIGARRLPASLKTILKEMAADMGVPMPETGNLSSWAEQGVLLLNTALTVEAGNAGSHLKIGWQHLVDEVIKVLSAGKTPTVFMLWGRIARKYSAHIDTSRHFILEAGHPSPLNRLRDFEGSKHFSKANEWLVMKGLTPINWQIP